MTWALCVVYLFPNLCLQEYLGRGNPQIPVRLRTITASELVVGDVASLDQTCWLSRPVEQTSSVFVS